MKRRDALASLAAFAATGAFARAGPAKPLRLVVPYSAGGPTDVLARAFAEHLGQGLGAVVAVDNKPGANTIIGAEIVAHAPADGYTLLLTTGTALTINQHLYRKLPYRPEQDFAPVGMLAVNHYVLYAHPSVPVNTVAELLAYARAHPGQLTIGLPGSATPTHLAIERLEIPAGIELTAVQYKGSALALNDLMGGHIDLVLDSPVVGMPHVRGGRLKALAVTAPQRMAAVPQAAAIAELIPGYEASSWFGIVAPAGTPADIVQRLNAQTRRFAGGAASRERLTTLGMLPRGGSVDEMTAFIASETQHWGELIRRTGLKLD